jgi:hypothetical protein
MTRRKTDNRTEDGYSRTSETDVIIELKKTDKEQKEEGALSCN